jgi:hypothetical protein
MKSKNIVVYFIIVIFICLSCKEKKKIDYKQLIIGKWSRPVNLEIEAPPPGFNKVTYTFFKDSAIYEPGLYKLTSKGAELSTYKYIGNKIKFEISEDTLKLYFPSSDADTDYVFIRKYKIVFINKDSLFLKPSDNRLFKYHKVK